MLFSQWKRPRLTLIKTTEFSKGNKNIKTVASYKSINNISSLVTYMEQTTICKPAKIRLGANS